MAEVQQDSLLREIDEELRQEKYAKLWKKYGHYVVGAAVALVVGVAGYQAWKSWDINTRTEHSARFSAALESVGAGNLENAHASLQALAEDAGSGYETLARLEATALLAQQGNGAAAVAAYREIAEDSAIAPVFRNLASLLAVLHGLDQGADPAALKNQLAPLAAENNPWRYSAIELLGVIARQTGDMETARSYFERLTEDAGTPPGIRSRAEEFLAILG